MSRFAADPGFGATLPEDGRVRFRIWAPGEPEADLEVACRALLRLRRDGEDWFEAEIACSPGAAHRYRFGDLAVPDPASRAQRGAAHGSSLVVDPRAYAWRTGDRKGRPWRETVLYEVLAGLLGGFEGVAARLPELKALGVTAWS